MTETKTETKTETTTETTMKNPSPGTTGIDIRHLSNLAKLRLTEAEAEAVSGDLIRIIAMVDEMRAMDTDGVAPLAHPLDSRSRLREDRITEVVDRDLYQHGAPATRDGYFLVPKVVE